jgi:transposase InsO family protein
MGRGAQRRPERPASVPSTKQIPPLELANAIFEYLEIFHNRQRRRSSLGMLSPIEYELRHTNNQTRDQAS